MRQAFPREDFHSPLKWGNEIEFIYVQESKYMMAWTSLLPDLEPQFARALVDFVGSRYPMSPQYQDLKRICPEVVFDNGDREWVFYGGTFNPWHQGHQACLNLLPAEKTCFILPDINPHKEERDFELVSTVLEISARARFNNHQFLVPTFLIQKTKNPTVDWMKRLRKEFPDQKLSLLIGFDSFSKITSWTRAQDLLPVLHHLYVVSRMETEIVREEAIEKVKVFAPSLAIELLGRHGFEELSSTEIRRRL